MDARLSANDDQHAGRRTQDRSGPRAFRARPTFGWERGRRGERSAHAELYDPSLALLHVWSWPMSGRGHAVIGHHADALHAALARIARPRSDLRTHLVHGDARKEIAEVARQTSAELIVLGTTGASGAASAQGLGTGAQRVLERAPVPVLLV